MIGRDGIAALVILVASGALFAATLGLADNPMVPIGPGFYPRLVLAITGALALAVLLSDLAVHRHAGAAAPSKRQDYRRVVQLFLAFGLYAAALPWLGFRVATLLFVAGAQAVLDPPRDWRRWIVLAAVALGTTALTYFAFERHLSVLLPRGRWTGF
jgi:putative tricarboxylic transport membrane protein